MKFKIKASRDISADELLNLVKNQTGETFQANWTGAWDKNDIVNARKTIINRGQGGEDAILIKNSYGVSAIYIGPYKLEEEPTEDIMLSFECSDAWLFDLN